MAVKRTSPDPMDNGMNRGQMQKKPKVQKKKKKRDPNEPQKYDKLVTVKFYFIINRTSLTITVFILTGQYQHMPYSSEIPKQQSKVKTLMLVLGKFQR